MLLCLLFNKKCALDTFFIKQNQQIVYFCFKRFEEYLCNL